MCIVHLWKNIILIKHAGNKITIVKCYNIPDYFLYSLSITTVIRNLDAVQLFQLVGDNTISIMRYYIFNLNVNNLVEHPHNQARPILLRIKTIIYKGNNELQI